MNKKVVSASSLIEKIEKFNKACFFISKNSIKRLARKSGIKRLSKSSYIDVNTYLYELLTHLIKDILIFCMYDKRKIINATDVIFSIKRNGSIYYG
mmetsp:Transcript_14110/g.34396  ORF Transcript_14110/g.34396 Transcript_14110/m.34396 type:complete len:96 (-) Transcript_14110:9-296(-)